MYFGQLSVLGYKWVFFKVNSEYLFPFICVFRSANDRVFRMSNLDSSFLCKNPKIKRSRDFCLSEVSRCKTHNEEIAKSKDDS